MTELENNIGGDREIPYSYRYMTFLIKEVTNQPYNFSGRSTRVAMTP
jgi:hypothetical protein